MTVIMVWGAWRVAQWPVSTRRGVNYVVREETIPLYLKVARFVARDLEYRQLARQLTAGLRDPEAKLLRLVSWVRAHVRAGIPDGMPVIDDHVWHIIVRGYGTADQLADVLATLCAYAGLPAQVVTLVRPDSPARHWVALVELGGRRIPIDPYYGLVIRTVEGRLATWEDVAADPMLVRRAAPGMTRGGLEYARWYEHLPSVAAPAGMLRPYRQMPLRRVWDELRRGISRVTAGWV